MIKGKLVMALDFGREKTGHAAHSPAAAHGAESRCVDGKWRVIKFGPTYSNTYEITEFDDVGLKWLEAHLPKETAAV